MWQTTEGMCNDIILIFVVCCLQNKEHSGWAFCKSGLVPNYFCSDKTWPLIGFNRSQPKVFPSTISFGCDMFGWGVGSASEILNHKWPSLNLMFEAATPSVYPSLNKFLSSLIILQLLLNWYSLVYLAFILHITQYIISYGLFDFLVSFRMLFWFIIIFSILNKAET